MGKFFTKEVKIGITVIICATLLVVGINFLKGVNLFTPTNYYVVSYDNVSGLSLSAPVNIEGFKVGLVREMKYDSQTGKINVVIEIEDDIKLPKGTTAELTKDLLGTATISLCLDKTSKTYHSSGDSLPSKVSTGLMSSVENEVLPQVTNLIPKIDSILVGINTIVTNPSLTNTIESLDDIAADVKGATSQLSQLMQTSIPNIVSNVEGATSNIKDLSANLKEVEIQKIVSSVDSTITNIRLLTDKMNDKNSTIGMLFNDSEMYDTIVKALHSADSLLIDLREHPKRYVQFSLIERKENKK